MATERNTRIRASQIASVKPNDMEATNSPTDDYLLSYDLATEKFTWVLAGAGSGDMLKSVYDTDDNGIVDKSKELRDADNDTKIQVEESADEDKIRMDVAGIEEVLIDSNGLKLKAGADVNEFSIDGTLAGNSDDAVPTEKAVKTYVDANSGGSKIQDADGDTSWDTEETADKDEIQGKVKGVEFFRGHDDGIITTEKQSGCRAYRSGSAQSIPTGIRTKAQLNGETFDIQNEYDSGTNYRYTAKKAGRYKIVGLFVKESNSVSGKHYGVYIYKNGASKFWILVSQSGGSYPGFLAVDEVVLSVNDYIEMFVFHNEVGATNLSYPEPALTITKVA